MPLPKCPSLCWKPCSRKFSTMHQHSALRKLSSATDNKTYVHIDREVNFYRSPIICLEIAPRYIFNLHLMIHYSLVSTDGFLKIKKIVSFDKKYQKKVGDSLVNRPS